MENTNIMNEEFENEVAVAQVESGRSVGGIVTKLAVGAALVATAAWLYKTKDKREAKRIEKLRKKGYQIIAPQNADEDDFVDVEE